MRKYAMIFTILIMVFAFVAPQPEAKAMDPGTIAILAPIAIQVAKFMLPHVLRGVTNMGRMGIKAGKELVNILRLPLGVVQSCLLFPFGRCFSSGLRNMGHGIIAPFKFGFYVFLLPFSFFGIGL